MEEPLPHPLAPLLKPLDDRRGKIPQTASLGLIA